MPLKKSNKNKKTTYDPSLKQGYDLLNNLSQQTVREIKSQPGIFHNIEAPQYSDAGESISDVRANEERENKLSTPFLGWFRDMANQFIESAVQNDEAQLHDINVELANLDEIEEYRDLMNKAEDVREKVAEYQRRGMNGAANYIMNENKALFDRIEQLNDIFQNDRRFTSDAIASLMYDKDKAGALDKAAITSHFMHNRVNSDHNAGIFRKYIAEPIANIFNLGLSVLETGAVGIEQLFGENEGLKTRNYIRSTPYDDPIVQKLYRGSSLAELNTAQFTKELQDYRRELNRQKNAKLAELGEDLHTQRTGNMHPMQLLQAVPVVGDVVDNIPSWTGAKMMGLTKYNTFGQARRDSEDYKRATMNVWHPEEGTAGWKQEREEQGQSLLNMIKHPAVSALQMGSSLGMIKYSLGAMSADAGILAAQALMGGLGSKAMTMSTTAYRSARLSKAVNDLDKAVKMTSAAKRFEAMATAAEGVNQALTGLNVGIGIASTVASRRSETNLEKIQGISQRVLTEATKRGVDLASVYASIINAGESQGYDTSKMNENEIVQLGLALGIQTGNEEYDNIARNATKGINKLINANNALAAKDFAQLLPWMSYGGKALNAFTKSVTNTKAMRKLTGAPEPYPMYLPKEMKMSDIQQNGPVFTGLLDATTNKIANRFFKKDFKNAVDAGNNIRKALNSKAITKYLGDKAKLVGFEGVSEGIEEGQQEIIQQLYQQGAYDGYVRPYDIFNTGEMFDDVNVAKQALFAYMGLNDDPRINSDEVRKAMNIGFISSVIQSGGMGVFRNLARNAEGSTRDLISTIKNDKTISRLIAENYDSIDDQNHLEFFYNALKDGNSASKLTQALFDIRRNVDPENTLVRHSYVDNDINMLYNVATLMNNKSWAKFLQDHEGVGKYSDTYKRATINGAKALTSYDTATRLRSDAADKMFGIMRNRQQVIENITSDMELQNSEDSEIRDRAKARIEEFKNTNPAEYEFVQKIVNDYSNYSEAVDNHNAQEGTSKIEKQTVSDYVKTNLEFLNRVIQMRVLKDLHTKSKNQKTFLDGFQRLTGLDYDTTTLGQIVNVLQKQITSAEKKERALFVDENASYELALRDLVDSELTGHDDLVKAFTEFYINDAVSVPLNTLAQPYRRFAVRPTGLKNALYGESKTAIVDDKDLAETVGQYVTTRDKLNRSSDVNEEYYDRAEALHNMEALSEKAAAIHIHNELEKDEHRRRIANQEWMDETPVTEQDINDAEAGDTNAQEKVNRAAERITQGQPTQKPGSNKERSIDQTEAGQRLSEKYEGANPRQKKKKDKILDNTLDQLIATQSDVEQEDQNDIDNENSEREEDAVLEEHEVTITEPGVEESEPAPEADEAKPEIDETLSEDETTVVDEENTDDGEDTPVDSEEDESEITKDDLTDDSLEDSENQARQSFKDQNAEFAAEEIVTEQTLVEERENEKANEESDQASEIFNIDVDSLVYDAESETFIQDGEPLSPEASDAIKSDLDPSTKPDDSNKVNATWDSIGSMVSNTLFYSVDEKYWDTPMSLKVGDEDVFDKPLNTAHELSERLLERGWLQKANKYFIVTEPTSVVENATKNANRYDNMTVVMIIESGNERYAVALRGLAKTKHEYIDPKTKMVKTYYDVGEINIKNSLRAKGIDIDKIAQFAGDRRIPDTKDTKALAKLINDVLNEQTLDRGLAVAKSLGIDEQDAETWWKSGPEKMPETLRRKYARNKAALDITRWRITHKEIDLAIRRKFAQPGKKVMSNEDIQNQINQLREFRNKIIDAYLVEVEHEDKKTGRKTKKKEIPSKVRKDVKPELVSQSNGTFDNVREDGQPVYRKIGKEDATIDEINQQIQSGELLFGYGHGVFGEKDQNGEAFQITGVRKVDETTVYPGKGKSGSVYWLVEGPSGSTTRTPVMLHSETFNTQERIVDGKRKTFYVHKTRRYSSATNSMEMTSPMVMCLAYDASTRELINQRETEGYIPSTAEILMYMLCRRFDFGTRNADDISDIIEFFIHSGEKTLLKNQPNVGEDPMNFLASKQLYFGADEDNGNKPTLWVGIGDKVSGYKRTAFAIDELFADTPQAAQDRATVAYAIAMQMHWNTDIDHMRSSINVQDGTNAVSRFIRYLILKDESLQGLTVDEQLKKTVSIMGNSQLSFKVSDFFTKDEHGDLKDRDEVGVLAWMISNKKLDTDVSQKVFKQPFVFVYGVKTSSTSQNVSTKEEIEKAKDETGGVSVAHGKEGKKKEKKSKGFSIFNPERFEQFKDAYGRYSRHAFDDVAGGFTLPQTEEERAQALENINNSVGISRKIRTRGEGFTVIDRILMPSTYTDEDVVNIDSAEDLAEVMTKKVNDFIDKYNAKYKTSIKHTEISPLKVTPLLNNIDTGYMYLDIQKNGEVNVQVDNGKGRESWKRQMTGIASRIKAGGEFDTQQARSWIQEHLGLGKANVVVQNALIRSCGNEKVYGLTNVFLDSLTGAITPIIRLSTKSGTGVAYHEAWHYVNLLLNDADTRALIWKDYLDTHKEFKQHLLDKYGKIENERIEEALAEEFRKYVEGKLDTSLKGRVKRLFSNILDLIVASRRKSEYRALFKAIQNGHFAKRDIDKASALQFKKIYPYGVASIDHSIPGFNQDTLQKLEDINSSDQLFRVLSAVTRKIISDFKIDSIEKINMLSGKVSGKAGITKQDIMDKVDQMMCQDDVSDAFAGMLQDVYDNPELVFHALTQELAKLGVNIKFEKGKDNTAADESTGEEITNSESITEKNEAKRRENSDVFSYDQMRLTVSKKQNAAMLTKMFFWSIPSLTKHTTRNGDIVIDEDVDEFGSQKFYDFNKAWTKILSDLWMCTSLDEKWDSDGNGHKAGEYKNSSIFGRVQQLAKADVFYEALMRKLTDISEGRNLNVQLRSQIFSTINSYKSQICYVELNDPYSYFNVADEDLGSMEGEFEMSIGSKMRTALVNDIARRWLIQDDSLLQVERALPRRWSKQIASLGLISYDKDSGGVVSEHFVDRVVQDHKDIVRRLSRVLSTDKKTKSYTLNDTRAQEEMIGSVTKTGVKEQIVEFLNSIGINMDMSSLEMYIAIQAEDLQGTGTNMRRQAEILNELMTNTAKSKGSIGLIVNKMKQSIGESAFIEQNATMTRGLDQLFNNYQSHSYLSKLAVAYNAVHPSSSEFSVRGPGDKVYYPINSNNYITDRIVALNDKDSGLAKDLMRDPYASRSRLARIANSKENNSYLTNIRAEVFVGMKDKSRQASADYFGITALEDYLSKMWMSENDMLVIPTMADKKTWYALKSSLFKSQSLFHHNLLINQPNPKILGKVIYQKYNDIHPIEHFDQLLADDAFDNSYRTEAKKWFYDLDTQSKEYRDIISTACAEQLEVNPSIYAEQDENGYLSFKPRFSNDALGQFAGYFLDELDALLAYYDESNIKQLLAQPNKLQENFHGSIMSNGRLDFSGNGGKFRYFYDLGITAPHSIKFYKTVNGKKVQVTNLNQILQSLFTLQQRIESDKQSEKVYVDENKQNTVGIEKLLGLREDKSGELDGFELIRDYLKQLRSSVVSKALTIETYDEGLLSAINDKLQTLVRSELETLSQDGPLHLIDKDPKTGGFRNYAIPEQFLNQYVKYLKDAGFSAELNGATTPMVIYSIIANHVLNTEISTIEFEKIFAGDPAQYKWKKDKKRKDAITIEGDINGISFNPVIINTDIVTDVSSDKIKRLGSELSPGDNIRTVFSEEERNQYNVYSNSKYTILDVEDLTAKSLFLEQAEQMFAIQLVVDYIFNSKPESFNEYVKEISKGVYEHKLAQGDKNAEYKELSQKHVIQMMYSNHDVYQKYYDRLPKEVKTKIEESLNLQMGPYKHITVSDAQVIIRPDAYRRIRIGLGDWSFKPDDTGYSDEDAYNILEKGYYIKGGQKVIVEDGAWLTDAALAKKVAKFQTYPLKMSYFQNDSEQQPGNNYFRNRATLNKMAMFALFKFHRSTGVGKQLYDRMNAEKNEIDMIAFKSAVKVGAVQNGALPVHKDSSVKDQVSRLSDELGMNNDGTPTSVNDQYLDYTNGAVNLNDKSGSLSIKVQDLRNLRFQLNTKAHEHDERNLGTQMLKIAFSNIYDDYDYGVGMRGRRIRSGKAIRRDIMNAVKLTNAFGQIEIRNEFYLKGSINRRAVRDWMARICLSNGLGTIAHQIITDGYSASSLMSRTVFENSASSFVNDNTVNIETAGGTAIQQSIFGFAEYDNQNVKEQVGQDGVNHYRKYNEGKELKWNSKDGSLQVLLSANFFRAVVPAEYRDSYESMRKWLKDNNIIGENSKPFGNGYRIPTQGQSSMFVMQVADIIPAQSGDTIIVPREFTSQTGSDFDVDKLFIATKTFVDGHELTIDDETFEQMAKAVNSRNSKELFNLEDQAAENWARGIVKDYDELNDEDKELAKAGYNVKRAIANRLLQNYMDILGDNKTYAAAHASIDVITSKIKDNVVDKIRGKSSTYTYGLSTMTPSFQAYRKMEFSVGKEGIAPFALNITNLSLTQTVHLSMNFNHLKSFNLKPLDSIYAEDNSRIADWLSAMVNAHVDVAKDPYIFTLNINTTTYNMTNFLIRTGKTLGALTFLAQPILKKYAQKASSKSSLYGGNVSGTATSESDINKIKDRQIIKDLYREYVGASEDEKGLIGRILNYNESLPETSKQRISDKDVKRFQNAQVFYKAVYNQETTKVKKEGVEDPFGNKSQILDYDKGLQAIETIREEEAKPMIERDLGKLLDAYVFQMGALHAWQLLTPAADRLAELVHESQIDTEKFGNTIAKQINFQNKYEQFKNNSGGWVLNIKDFDKIVEEETKKFEKRLSATYGDAIPKSAVSGFASRYALRKYFGDTWLDSMFYSARKYTQEILSGQVFPATKEFKQVFKYIMGTKFGYTNWIDFNGNSHEGYNPNGGANEKVAQEISNAIDNVMRAVAFTRMGYSTFQEIQDRYPDAIDFTMGGNSEAVYERMRDILFGNSKQDDIFTRLRSLMNKMKTYKGKDGKYDMYRDSITHDITNSLLLYLNPIPKVGDDPIGKMSLTRMQSLTSDEEKIQLQAAFSQLLSSPDQEIKSLAEDLAFYAYYSQYDQNKANSFFDLVPSEYRAQYDETLRKVCKQLDDFANEDVRKEALLGMLQDNSYDISTPIGIVETAFSDMLMDLIARNYWNDENIVRTYYVKQREATLDSNWGDIFGELIVDDNGNVYPSYLLSTAIQNHPRYISVKSAGKKMIYRRIGFISRQVKEGDKHAAPFYIYIPVQKLGYQSRNVSQYEFNVDELYGSMFPQNKIAGEFRETIARREIDKYVKEFDSDSFNFDVVYDSEQIPVSRGLESAAYLNIEEGKDRDDRKKLGGTSFIQSNSPEAQGGGKADVIIDFHLNENNDALHDYAMENEKLKGKTIVVNLSTSPSDILDKVLSLKQDKPIRIHFCTPYFDLSFANSSEISKEEIDNYIQQRLDILESQYKNDPSINNEDVPALLKVELGDLEKKAKFDVAQAKFNEFISRLTGLLVQNQVKIERFTSSSTRQRDNKKIFKTMLAKSVKQIKDSYPQYFEKQNNVYVNNKTIYSDPKARNRYLYYIQQQVSDGIANIDYTPLEAVEAQSEVLEEVQTTVNKTNSDISVQNSQVDFGGLDLLGGFQTNDNALLSEITEDNKEDAQNKNC